MVRLLLWSVGASCFSGIVAAVIPAVMLNNGVEMPQLLLGMGPWCKRPDGSMGDCYNASAAKADVLMAFSLGIFGIDTAKGYGAIGANTGIGTNVCPAFVRHQR
eukprot:SAG11_NODE_868_length_6814_cov_13.161430_5_plen_104_part_00